MPGALDQSRQDAAARQHLRSIARPAPVPVPRSPRIPRLIAAAVAASGLITLISAAVPSSEGLGIVWHAIPLPIRTGAASAAALSGVGTMVIAGALARRQRRAWWIATVLLGIAAAAHVLKDLDAPSAGVSAGMSLVLLRYRHEFDARPGPGTIRRAVVALP